MFTRIVLMVFGSAPARFWEAHYCLLSLLANAPSSSEILVLTDHPQRFAYFAERIRVQPVSAGQLAEWVGPHGYFLRTLITSILYASRVEPAPDVVVYMDVDTVVRSPLGPLVQAVAAGAIGLDKREYRLAASRRRGDRKLWRQVADRPWAGTTVTTETDMWNTGVTAISKRDFPLIEQALAATDALLAAGRRHYLLEQIAMSAVLSADGRAFEVNPADQVPVVGHYWGNKAAYDAEIAQTLATIHTDGLGIEAAIARIAQHPIRRPLHMRLRWWHRLLAVVPAH